MDIKFLKNDNILDINVTQDLLKKLGFINSYVDSSNRYFELKQQIKFYGDGEPTFELFDETRFKELVDNTAKEVNIILEKILKNEEALLSVFLKNITI
jgi:hypothetical protein